MAHLSTANAEAPRDNCAKRVGRSSPRFTRRTHRTTPASPMQPASSAGSSASQSAHCGDLS